MTTERCCPRHACEYSPARVRYHMGRLRAYQRAGEQPGRLHSQPSLERYGGAPGDGETASLDIQRAIEQLRADGQAVTVENVARQLCPWSTDDA